MKHKSLRVVLVRPDYDVLEKFSKPVECLALGYLASALRQDGVEVVLLDGMVDKWNNDELVKEILANQPAIVGFTVVLNYFPKNLQQIAFLLKQSGFNGPIIVGGHAVSFIPQRILSSVKEVDIVVSGEGEYCIRKFVEAYRNQENWKAVPGISARDVNEQIITNPPIRNRDLDNIAPPARDLIPALIKNDGLVAISTSRGCYARCTFCSIPRFYGLHKNKPLAVGDWLSRSTEHVVNEFMYLKEQFALNEVLIVDDEFFGGTSFGFERALKLGQSLSDRGAPIDFAISFRAENADEKVLTKLREGGLAHVFMGIEAGTSPDLKLYGKGHTVDQNIRAIQMVKSLGLSFQPGMMVFNHKSTMQQIMNNIDFLISIDEFKPILVNSAADPHFGTPLLNVLKRDNVLQDNITSLESCYLDKKVKFAKLIAEQCALSALKYMQLICTLQSAVTYEWRRVVPGRQSREANLINNFEKSVNKAFSNVIYWAFNEINNNEVIEIEMMKDVEHKLNDIHSKLELSTGLLSSHLNKCEGGIRYWSQSDMIERRKCAS